MTLLEKLHTMDKAVKALDAGNTDDFITALQLTLYTLEPLHGVGSGFIITKDKVMFLRGGVGEVFMEEEITDNAPRRKAFTTLRRRLLKHAEALLAERKQ